MGKGKVVILTLFTTFCPWIINYLESFLSCQRKESTGPDGIGGWFWKSFFFSVVYTGV